MASQNLEFQDSLSSSESDAENVVNVQKKRRGEGYNRAKMRTYADKESAVRDIKLQKLWWKRKTYDTHRHLTE
jgi:hypothetical protein